MEKLTVRRRFSRWLCNSRAVNCLLRLMQCATATTAAGKVLLIEQFRIGTLDKSRTLWLMEVVAGLIEGEMIENTALRRRRRAAHSLYLN